MPIDWLRAEWKRRRLIGMMGMSISSCLGSCDLLNVVSVVARDCTIRLGGFTTQAHYDALADWANESAAAGQLLPLPLALHTHVFEQFRPEATSPLQRVSGTPEFNNPCGYCRLGKETVYGR